MQYKFFTIPAVSGDIEQNEADLNAFLRSHRVLTVQRELISNGQQSCWCCCVEYIDSSTGESKLPTAYNKKIDYREILSEEEFAKFRVLREVRKIIAETDHIPAYAILIDEQLAELSKKETVDEEALKALNGFGEKKWEKYGERLLSKLAEKKNETSGSSI